MSTTADQPEFTNGYESLAQLIPGLPIWATLGSGRRAKTYPGVVKGNHYKGVNLWIDIEFTWQDLAGQEHTTAMAVRPVQLRRREESIATTIEEG